MSAQLFLQKYRQMEEMLDAKYTKAGVNVASPVIRFMEDPESEPFRDRLDICRQVRNILSHAADIDGAPPVEPAPALIDGISAVIDYLVQPPLALTRATPVETLLVANGETNVLKLMRAMEKSGYSHVPVLSGEHMLGVFSVSSVFSYVLEGAGREISPHTRVNDFMRHIPVAAHATERFLFARNTITLPDARAAFQISKRPHEKRMAAIFITESGDISSPLIAMLTPWDVMK